MFWIILLCVAIAILLIFALFFSLFKTSWPKNWKEFKWEVRCIFYTTLSNFDDNSFGLCYNRVSLYKQEGKIAILTGGNRGIGLRTLKMLLECEITVILAVRNIDVAKKSVEDFIKNPQQLQKVFYEKCDISDMASVRLFALNIKQKYPKINLLINNAGILGGPRTITKDGFELQMASNYVGHFLLSHLLLPQLIAGANESTTNSRIVNVSSCAHLFGTINYDDFNNHDYYHGGMAYADSKFAQILYTKRLNQLCKDNNWRVQVNACHPGVVDTEIFQNTFLGRLKFLRRIFFKTPEQGARSIVFTAIDPSLENRGGTYITNCRITKISKQARTMDDTKFFKFSCDQFNIKNYGNEREQISD